MMIIRIEFKKVTELTLVDGCGSGLTETLRIHLKKNGIYQEECSGLGRLRFKQEEGSSSFKLARRLPRYIGPQTWRRNGSRTPHIKPDPLIPFRRSRTCRPKIGIRKVEVHKTTPFRGQQHPQLPIDNIRSGIAMSSFKPNSTRTRTENELHCIYTCLTKTICVAKLASNITSRQRHWSCPWPLPPVPSAHCSPCRR